MMKNPLAIFILIFLHIDTITCQQTQWTPRPQLLRDEFNFTMKPEFDKLDFPQVPNSRQFKSLRRVLMRENLTSCCEGWKNLTSNSEIQEELRKKFGKAKMILKPVDLQNELKQVFHNITYLSIDAQEGDSELEKYYNFLDGVEYFLRLLKVAHNYINSSTNNLSEESEFNVEFKRQLKTIEFKVNQDPTLSSYLSELKSDSNRRNFYYFEDFIRYTEFGQYYAKNVSMIRESVQVFDQIRSHIITLRFPSNMTRPSKQYEMIRRMSYELFLIRNELSEQINPRILATRRDARRLMRELDNLAREKPFIRLLGDEFSSSPPYFSSYVRQLTHLLDAYTTNSLTQVSFYDQLSELPEEFIVLGSSIARDYEQHEIPQMSRYDPEYFNTNWDTDIDAESDKRVHSDSEGAATNSTDPRRSNSMSMLRRLIG